MRLNCLWLSFAHSTPMDLAKAHVRRKKRGRKLLEVFRRELDAVIPDLEKAHLTLALETLPSLEGFPNAEEAEALIAGANRQIEHTIRTIREAQAEKELTRLARKELDDYRAEVEKAETKAREEEVQREIKRIERRRQRREERKAQQGEKRPTEAAPQEKPREVEVGSKVKMVGQAVVGVVQAVQGKRAQVAFGQMLTTVNKALLTVVSNNEYREATRPTTARTVYSSEISERKLNFRDHIDVRGMRAAEALEEVRDFIDDAVMVGIGTVTILHGKGTGALKEEIRRYLRSVREVASATDEHADRGGAGITIVTFHP